MAGRAPFSGPLFLSVVATFPIAKSWSAKKKASARYHTSRPDADNILKAIGDGLNGVVWGDDAQIARASIEKRYGATPGVLVEIGEADGFRSFGEIASGVVDRLSEQFDQEEAA
jgi:Holliday junction resolvase RusA-like endonuclease